MRYYFEYEDLIPSIQWDKTPRYVRGCAVHVGIDDRGRRVFVVYCIHPSVLIDIKPVRHKAMVQNGPSNVSYLSLVIDTSGRAFMYHPQRLSFVVNDPPTKDMIDIVVRLCKKRGAASLRIEDTTRYTTVDCLVSDVQFLSTGYTFYESLIPYTAWCSYNHVDNSSSYIENHRKRIQMYTWFDVEKHLRNKASNITLPSDISDIDILEEGSAMRVCHRIWEDDLKFFHTYMGDIPPREFSISLIGLHWIFNLNAPL